MVETACIEMASHRRYQSREILKAVALVFVKLELSIVLSCLYIKHMIFKISEKGSTA